MYAVVVFGDSITFGRGDNKNRGWCGRIRRNFEQRDYYNVLYNLGIPGENSTGLLKRMRVECESRLEKKHEGDKTAIVVAIGINDSRYLGSLDKPETTANQFRENIAEIIKIAKEYGDRVVYVGLIPVDEEITADYEGTQFFNDRIKEFNSIIRENCRQEKLQYIDVFNVLSQENLKETLDDGLHPNHQGYEILYNWIHRELNL